MKSRPRTPTLTQPRYSGTRYWQFVVGNFLVLWQCKVTLRGGVRDGLPQCLN